MKNSKRHKKAIRRRFVIRQVDPVANADVIAQLLKEGFNGPAEDSGSRASTFLGVSFWLAFEVIDGTEKPVGVAGMCHSAIEEGTMYLNRSYVMADARGHGLQQKLIKARVARAKELKGSAATSDTWDTPYSANNLIACGFRAYKPSNPWRTEGVMYWKLPLKVKP